MPFAAAPVAGLRWRPPQPVAPWQGVLETVHAAPSCPQPLPPPGSFYQKEFFLTSERQSEDCLYLNIWTPARAPDEKLPVMVWFYGGGFVQGSGSLPSFDGEALAHRGVIVVTINYRLGPLGFLALPALDQESPDHVSGNYGLLDMIAALRWMQNNVGGFGGDPGNVTIFGQSAGAFGVNAMMASPLAHGLFRRAIVESYPMFGISSPTQNSHAVRRRRSEIRCLCRRRVPGGPAHGRGRRSCPGNGRQGDCVRAQAQRGRACASA